MIERVTALMLDLDGVIVDSSIVVERHWQRWAIRKNVPLEQLRPFMHGHRTVDVIQRFAYSPKSELEAAELEAREGADCDGLREVSGARALITSLPVGTWGVVTSSSRLTSATRLEAVGLPIPDILVTAEEVTAGKPSPEGYILCAQRLRTPPNQCIVVEDTPAGIVAGRSAGAKVIAVATTNSKEELEIADFVVRDLSSLSVTQARTGLPLRRDLLVSIQTD